MQTKPLPVLIFAQSGRFIAQSATQAGYRVWVADCFGDIDTLDTVERWQQLNAVHRLTQEQILTTFARLSGGEDCLLICGSGIEQHYPILNMLPSHIKLMGNTATIINTIQQPTAFFSLLKRLNLPHPETQFKQPEYGDWLAKSCSGFGGLHIQTLATLKQQDNNYYQRYISGTSGSALFIANGEHAQTLNIYQHYLQPSAHSPFRLGGITSPWQIAQQHQDNLSLAADILTASTGLCGINSIDFIISEQDQLFLLEINPRFSASAELLNCKGSLFQHHVNACNGLLAKNCIIDHPSHSQLHYLYATQDLQIPSDMTWPHACHDIPHSGSFILKDDPICTLQIQAENSKQLQKYYNNIEREITLQLSSNLRYSSSSKL